MSTITKVCLHCLKEFEAPLREHNRGNAKFCSLSCSSKYAQSKITLENNVRCNLCGKEFHMSPSKQTNSKSGLYYCCREHKDLFQTGSNKYRAKAFRELPNECSECGYKKYPQLLEVHHKDKDRENSSIENLEILCPTCHQKKHFLDSSGRYKLTTS